MDRKAVYKQIYFAILLVLPLTLVLVYVYNVKTPYTNIVLTLIERGVIAFVVLCVAYVITRVLYGIHGARMVYLPFMFLVLLIPIILKPGEPFTMLALFILAGILLGVYFSIGLWMYENLCKNILEPQDSVADAKNNP
jgi:hypothetical protein